VITALMIIAGVVIVFFSGYHFGKENGKCDGRAEIEREYIEKHLGCEREYIDITDTEVLRRCPRCQSSKKKPRKKNTQANKKANK